jgi:hypothetical protein
MDNIQEISTDIVQIHKMVFVFNAILAGWTVRMLNENTFEFKKDLSTQDVNLDDYLRRFVLHNLNIDNLPNINYNKNATNKDNSGKSK